MKHITLTQGRVAIVDDTDYEMLSELKWYYSEQGYAMRNTPMVSGVRKGHISMHRVIVGSVNPGFEIDHINRNKLDNRRDNLRVTSRSVNMHNKPSARPNTSGYRGVCFDKSKEKEPWMAYISFEKKRKHIGYYETKEEAALAYNALCKLYYPGSDFINHISA